MGRLFESEDAPHGRLIAMLDPRIQDALTHPVRREVLRILSRSGKAGRVAEIKAELPAFRLGELSYHLLVLWRSGAVISSAADGSTDCGHARYEAKIDGDGPVRALLRATEKGDRERREAAAAANASPLLTMFRVPRPVRTIRLRGRSRTDAERDR